MKEKIEVRMIECVVAKLVLESQRLARQIGSRPGFKARHMQNKKGFQTVFCLLELLSDLWKECENWSDQRKFIYRGIAEARGIVCVAAGKEMPPSFRDQFQKFDRLLKVV